MFSGGVLLIVTAGYLSLLFLLAYYAERRSKTGRSLVANPYVYSLSLAVYCTSWTFYGSVGKAASSGFSFLTIYLGPTLMAVLWGLVLTRIINIAKEHRITSIADFIGFRYGNSIALAAIVTVVAAVGLTPYLGLQIKAIISTFTILSGQTKGSFAAGWVITLIIGLFAMIFGVRQASERHEGLVFAIAVESIVKLAAFLVVGFYVTYVLFGGHADILQRIKDTQFSELLHVGGAKTGGYSQWASLTFLSMMAIMFLPRQFQVAVVENNDVRHVAKAMWLFPLYLFLINLFVVPVAFGGLLMSGSSQGSDNFMLTIPMGMGQKYLALFVFLGGFSAASGMIIVESMAISNMVMNTIVNPVIYRYNRMRGFHLVQSNIKRIVILGLVFTGYIFAVSIGEVYSLVDMGLKSFEAVTIFAPSFLLGLYWKRGNRKGAIAGVVGGFIVWFYTLLMPALIKAGIIAPEGTLGHLLDSHFLNPHALFGLEGLDRWSHSLFWGLFVNIGLYVGVSIFTSPTSEDERQAFLFVESYSPRVIPSQSTVDQIEEILTEYIGAEEGRSIVSNFLARKSIDRQNPSEKELLMLMGEARRTLSGALGSSIANLVLQDRLMQTEQERQELLDSIKQMRTTLRYSRRELAEANRQLSLLKEFSENIIESLPLGVATLDENLRVTYWNRSMEEITGVHREEALGNNANAVLGCLSPGLVSQAMREGDITCSTSGMELKGYISRLTGAARGSVVVLEDITEKKKIEEELFRATKHASIGRLAAGVSHEIGNPLASISSLVQELLAEGGSDFQNDSLLTINHHIDRIARIVRSLGDFARLYPRQKIAATLESTLERTLDLVRFDKNFRKIKVSTDITPTPKLRLDPDQMQQVFLNLILNARDAMPDGGSLNISIGPSNGGVTMVFEDTGEGIAQADRDKIFDPFFSTKAPTRGSGLGLSVSYSIIKDHGGSIEVESLYGGGTKFIISLPVPEEEKAGEDTT